VPIRVRVSDALSFMLIEFDGTVTDEEFRREVLPLVAEPVYNTMRRTLVDATAATDSDARGTLIRNTAWTVASHVDAKIEAGARIAMAAPGDEFFGLGRMYQALRSDSPVEVGVFRELAAAEAWLDLPAGYRDDLTGIGSPSAD